MSRGSILIVEDETIVAADLASKLERLGYEVVGSARRGEEAVDFVRSSPPDLILMDVQLQGGIDGVDAAATIRSNYTLPVIYLTAHSDAGTLARAKMTEPFGYILKPFEERELEITIDIALCKHKAEERLRKSSELLAKANQELENKVQEYTSKLREAVADLEQFSYSIVHDLRAPLRTMNSFSSILLQDHQRALNAEAADYLRRIGSAAKRMDDLIRDVLSYSRVVRADATLTRTDLDVLTREVIEHYPQLNQHQAAIAIKSPLLAVAGNSVLLTQCLSNFLDNAVKFANSDREPRITVWTVEVDGNVRLCVQDNGPGIDPAQIDRIWHLFERAHDKQHYEGTGIGLSIVKRAIERMGGTVGVKSKLGEGTVFWFELAKA